MQPARLDCAFGAVLFGSGTVVKVGVCVISFLACTAAPRNIDLFLRFALFQPKLRMHLSSVQCLIDVLLLLLTMI